MNSGVTMYHGAPKCFYCKERRMERIGQRLYRCRNEDCPGAASVGIGEAQIMRFGALQGIFMIPLKKAVGAEA